MFRFLVLFLAFLATPAQAILPQPTSTNLDIYLSPSGSDSNSGLSSSTPLKTLTTAQQVLKALNPTQNVVIHVLPGTYYNQSVSWTFVRPDYLLTIQGEGTPLPIFDGCQMGTACSALTFFALQSSTGNPSNVVIQNLQIQRYWMGISLNGNYLNFSMYNWNNTIQNNVFQDIGNGWNSALPYSYAAVRLYNSRNNKVTHNTFKNIVNLGDYDGYIHAIYAASWASSNSITYNSFQNISGDVVRIRDTSNSNWIGDNDFSKSGKYAQSSDWYCAGTGCDKVECPSWNNKFDSNNYGYTYALFTSYPGYVYGSSTSPGCSAPSTTSTRLSVTNNTYLIQ